MALTVQLLVNRVKSIYSLPTIYTRIDHAIHDPRSNLEDIGHILAEDSGLSARLLRLANSAMYNFPSRVDTITRAIAIIGTQQLRDLVLATSVIQMFKGIDAKIVDMEQFWHHSIATGIAARVLTTYQREGNVERFYLMGLLHDIGRLIMYTQIPQQMSQLLQQAESPPQLLYRLERQQLGFDHAAVGRLLLKNWQLPEAIQHAVGYHHNPTGSASWQKEAAVIHCADVLVYGMALGSSGEHFVPKLSDMAWQSLKLPASLLPDILQHTEQQFNDAVAIFLS